jgi:hypothetical protein
VSPGVWQDDPGGLSGDFTDRTGFTLNNQMIPVGTITRATISEGKITIAPVQLDRK